MQVSSADVGLQVSSADESSTVVGSSSTRVVSKHVKRNVQEPTEAETQRQGTDVMLSEDLEANPIELISSADVGMHVSAREYPSDGSATIGARLNPWDARRVQLTFSARSATLSARENPSDVRVPDKMEQFDQFVTEVEVHGRGYLIDDMLRMSFTHQNVFRLARCLGRKFGTPVASKTQCRKLGYGYSLNHDILFGVFYMCTRLKISEIHGFTRQRATRDAFVEGILQDLIVVQGGPRTLGEHIHASFWNEDFSQWTLQDTRRVLGSVGT
jgi:hypothetical protein